MNSTTTVTSPSLLSVVGRSYFPIAFMARLPYAMVVIGVLTLVVAGRGSMSLGGINSAMVGLGTALFGSFIGAAADRWGQRPVLLVVGLLNCLALIFMAWVVYSPLSDWVVLAAAFAIGATAPQVAPMSRSRLVEIVMSRLPAQRRPKVLNGTMAYESAADEVVFVFGPFVVGLLATALHPVAPIIGAVVMTLVFVSSFALHRTGRVRPHAAADTPVQAPARELFTFGILVIVLGVLGIGMVFGSTLTALTSLTNDLRHPEQAGLIYGIMGIGSAVFAISVAFFSPRFALWARWLCFAPVLLAGAVTMSVAADMIMVVIALLLMGCAVGPTLVTLFSLAAERSPQGRSATVMSMVGSAIIVGQSLASAVNGILAEAAGTATAMMVPMAASALVVLAGLLNLLIRARRRRRDLVHT
ncbi:putative MFS family arabinose efflux permease [Brevibacterium sanguinis]|uniref:MFS family arabinose efflux permease n=2 Tax=Brevibacterium TaxID=1696 RepID=A0ABX9GRV7_9MICO|nr:MULTISPECIES: MFS transporter [Brevibacterium]RBP64199.1 putative MFS family arabinose efflux permease [Brevibacterium sanguinis]RBP71509.1 putative MFS family arabinose efflux permease [Brevibacterium celere]